MNPDLAGGPLLEQSASKATKSGRRDALTLGVMIFLASEALLFNALFALYASYRTRFPEGFAQGVRLDLRWDGTLNTFILLISSAAAAAALTCLARGRRRCCITLLLTCESLGCAFLGFKAYEYADHWAQGLRPGSANIYAQIHGLPGLSQFVDLYYLMTGLHALHVLAGMAWLGAAILAVKNSPRSLVSVELATMYWHFVDVLWVFLWPLFYLLRGSSGHG